MPAVSTPESLFVPRHPDDGCHQSQVELLTLEENDDERAPSPAAALGQCYVSQRTHLRVTRHFFAAHFGHKLRLLPAVGQLGAEPNCRAVACVLRLSEARRSASALNASSYLRRLSGDAPFVLVAMTWEIYVFLLSVMPRPPQNEVV